MKLKKILRAHCNDDVQDNMIDEEKAKAEEAAQEAIEQKLERLEGNLGSIRSLEIQGKVKDKDRIRQRQIRAKARCKFLYIFSPPSGSLASLVGDYSSFQAKMKQVQDKIN